jgi:hypothetical protein
MPLSPTPSAGGPDGFLPTHNAPIDPILAALRATDQDTLLDDLILAHYQVLRCHLPDELHDRLELDNALAETIGTQVGSFVSELLDEAEAHARDCPFWERFRRLYVNWIGDEERIREHFDQLRFSPAFERDFFGGLDRWLRSRSWHEGYIPAPLKWLIEERWRAYPQALGKPPLVSDRQRAWLAERERLKHRPTTEGDPWTAEQKAVWDRHMEDLRSQAHAAGRTPTYREILKGREKAHAEIATSQELARLLLGHIAHHDVPKETRQDQQATDNTNQQFLHQTLGGE